MPELAAAIPLRTDQHDADAMLVHVTHERTYDELLERQRRLTDALRRFVNDEIGLEELEQIERLYGPDFAMMVQDLVRAERHPRHFQQPPRPRKRSILARIADAMWG